MKRINSLDGLRGISIGLVLLSHAGLGAIVPGGLGVTIFFFISGYIITRLLMREQDGTGAIDIPAFYLRRAFRILPALLVYLAACTAYLVAVYGLFEPWHLLSAVFNVYNYYYIFFLDHSGPVGTHHPYGIVWSLAVEEHYYFIYPFACFALMARPHRLVGGLVLLCMAALVWRFYLAYGVGLESMPAERIYKATDTRIDSIGFGALFALVRPDGSKGHQDAPAVQWLRFGFGLLLLLATLLVRNEEFRQSLRYSVQGLALYLMFEQLVVLPSGIAKALAGRPLVWLGRISYSLYLWHWLVLIALEKLLPGSSPPSLLYSLMVGISLIVAQLSFQCIEQPMLRQGQRLLQRRAELRLAHS